MHWTAASEVLIPVQCEYYALEEPDQLVETINRIRDGLNPRLEITGLVRTMYDGRNGLALRYPSSCWNISRSSFTVQ